MKQIYKLSQRLIAGLVIFSVFIQSCINPTTAAISKEETTILEVISQLNDQGGLKQLVDNKFIAGKVDDVALASQAEELRNANYQGEVLLTAKGEEKVEGQQEQKNEWDFAKDQTEEKVESFVKLVEVNKCNEKIEAGCLGDLGILPIEVVEKILTYVPCDKIRKEKRGEQKVTGIFAVRQVNRIFYELTTGYSQPGLVGVEHRPNRCIYLDACVISKIISFDDLNLATVPSFIFYQFIRKVWDLPKEFWPYLQGTNIHTLRIKPECLAEIIELINNIAGTQVHTLDLSYSPISRSVEVGLGQIAKNLQGTKVHTVNLSNICMERVGAVEFTKNLAGTQVHTLYLNSNNIQDEGIAEIAKNLQGTKVHTLDLGRNYTGDKGITNFAKNLQITQVHTVDVSNNNIGDASLGEFAKNLQGTQVHMLDLSNNNIGDASLVEFAKNLQGTKVRILNLRGNHIGDPSIGKFAKNLQGTKVNILNLEGNNIGKAGLMEFTKNLIDTEVEEINISRNKISWNKIKSTQEILEFGQILATTKVRKIDFSFCNTHPTEQKLLIRKYPHIDWEFRYKRGIIGILN